MEQEDRDNMRFGGLITDEYAVGEQYRKLHKNFDTSSDKIWKDVWSLKVPERVRVFVWLLNHDRLLTNYRKSLCGIGSAACQLCGSVCESSLHALRDCPVVKRMWDEIVPINFTNVFYAGNLQDWIRCNMNCLNVYPGWCNKWAIGCHATWTWRNKDLHIVNHTRPPDVGSNINERMNRYSQAMALKKTVVDKQPVVEKIRWMPPSPEFVKINVDGSCGKNNLAGCGGVIRDRSGNWIRGFSKFIGTCSAFMAEAWGLLEGLKLTSARGFTKIVINMDARRVIDAVKQKDKQDRSSLALIRQIRLLMAKHDVVILEHTSREANSVADELARSAREMQNGFNIFEDAPAHIKILLHKDTIGHVGSRVLTL